MKSPAGQKWLEGRQLNNPGLVHLMTHDVTVQLVSACQFFENKILGSGSCRLGETNHTATLFLTTFIFCKLICLNSLRRGDSVGGLIYFAEVLSKFLFMW